MPLPVAPSHNSMRGAPDSTHSQRSSRVEGGEEAKSMGLLNRMPASRQPVSNEPAPTPPSAVEPSPPPEPTAPAPPLKTASPTEDFKSRVKSRIVADLDPDLELADAAL